MVWREGGGGCIDDGLDVCAAAEEPLLRLVVRGQVRQRAHCVQQPLLIRPQRVLQQRLHPARLHNHRLVDNILSQQAAEQAAPMVF